MRDIRHYNDAGFQILSAAGKQLQREGDICTRLANPIERPDVDRKGVTGGVEWELYMRVGMISGLPLNVHAVWNESIIR